MGRRIVVMPQSNDKPNAMVRRQQSNSPELQRGNEGATENANSSATRNINNASSTSSRQQYKKSGDLYVDVESIDTTRPIGNASVKLYKYGTENEVVDEKTTDQSGNARFDNLTASSEMQAPFHTYDIMIEAPGYERMEIKGIEIVADETTNRKARLSRRLDRFSEQNAERVEGHSNATGNMRVKVRKAGTQAPIIGANVKVYNGVQNGTLIREVGTDERGVTPVISMPADSSEMYRIAVSADGYKTLELRNIDLEPGETMVENIYLNPDSNQRDVLHSMETLPPTTPSTTNFNSADITQGEQESRASQQPVESQNLSPQTGRLRVDVTSVLRSRPIIGATVTINYEGQTGTPIQEVTTDVIGRTDEIELATPNVGYSLEPSVEQPYATYDILVEAPGYESVEINSAEVLAGILAIQNVTLMPLENAQGESAVLYVIPPHTLFGDYPPKIAEAETKPAPQSGEIVLSKIVVPEYVVVHDGPPNDTSATNYYVKYKDYIKNVASSEIYATWPEATIMANVLCIQSFVLNRVYTEWYRNRGYAFTITNSTAYDQKFIAGRNIFDSISEVVDQMFSNYLARPNVEQPILTQFCDGRKVSCPNWLSQWGSKELGDQGYTALEIIRYYFGDDMYIGTAEEVSGVPASWPGVELQVGSRSDAVRQIQRQLNVVSTGYPLIPKVSQDGVYGEKTADAVKVFQKVFDLPETGVVDYPTWYKISEIYVGVSRIAELN